MKYNMAQEEIDDIVLSRNLDLCVLAAKLGFGLDVLVNDDEIENSEFDFDV